MLSMTKEEIEDNFDAVKAIVIEETAKEFGIDLEDATMFAANTTIIVRKKNVFSSFRG